MVLRGNIIVQGWKVEVRVWYESRAVMILLDLAANKKNLILQINPMHSEAEMSKRKYENSG